MLNPFRPYLVCARAADLKGVRVAHLRTYPCAVCSAKVVATPASQKLIAQVKAQPVCPTCHPPGVPVQGMTPEQQDELKRLRKERN